MQHPWLEARVARKRVEAEGIVSLALEAADGPALPAFEAGAHVDVEIRPGLVRQYSLCNAPRSGSRYVIAVLREPASRGGSAALHDDFHEGDRLRIGAPRNLFALAAGASPALLVAGGIGVTPLLAMAEELLARGADFELHYCARSWARAAFRERLAEPDMAGRTVFHVDGDDATRAFDPAAAVRKLSADSHVYVCGPAGFIEWIVGRMLQAGWPAERLHREYFQAVPGDVNGDTAFEVRIASTGQVVAVPPGRSVAAALADAGIEVALSCDQGVCGTCITRVLAGTPDHRDQLGLGGNDRFTPCCSRSATPLLVLDI